MPASFLGLPLWTWGGLICLGVAALFGFVVPHPVRSVTGAWRLFALRWGHSLVWVLLAAMCFLRALGQPGPGNLLGLAGGLSYAVFLFVLLTSRQ